MRASRFVQSSCLKAMLSASESSHCPRTIRVPQYSAPLDRPRSTPLSITLARQSKSPGRNVRDIPATVAKTGPRSTADSEIARGVLQSGVSKPASASEPESPSAGDTTVGESSTDMDVGAANAARKANISRHYQSFARLQLVEPSWSSNVRNGSVVVEAGGKRTLAHGPRWSAQRAA